MLLNAAAAIHSWWFTHSTCISRRFCLLRLVSLLLYSLPLSQSLRHCCDCCCCFCRCCCCSLPFTSIYSRWFSFAVFRLSLPGSVVRCCCCSAHSWCVLLFFTSSSSLTHFLAALGARALFLFLFEFRTLFPIHQHQTGYKLCANNVLLSHIPAVFCHANHIDSKTKKKEKKTTGICITNLCTKFEPLVGVSIFLCVSISSFRRQITSFHHRINGTFDLNLEMKHHILKFIWLACFGDSHRWNQSKSSQISSNQDKPIVLQVERSNFWTMNRGKSKKKHNFPAIIGAHIHSTKFF